MKTTIHCLVIITARPTKDPVETVRLLPNASGVAPAFRSATDDRLHAALNRNRYRTSRILQLPDGDSKDRWYKAIIETYFRSDPGVESTLECREEVYAGSFEVTVPLPNPLLGEDS